MTVPRDLWSHQQVILEKQKLDVFSNPTLVECWKKLGSVREVILYGVVTEICVAYAWEGLARRGYRLRIVTDATRHLDEANAKIFLDGISKSGGMLVTSGDLIAELSLLRAA